MLCDWQRIVQNTRVFYFFRFGHFAGIKQIKINARAARQDYEK